MSRFKRGASAPTNETPSDSKFLRVGSILTPFKDEYETNLDPADADGLRNLNCTLNLNYYFSDFTQKKYPEIIKNGKITLQPKDRIRLRFTPPKGAKDFVVGTASLKIGEDEYVDIGNITVTKASSEKEPGLADDLKTAGFCLTYQVYLPKEVDSIEVASKENYLLNFRVWDNDQDFVLGHVSAIK